MTAGLTASATVIALQLAAQAPRQDGFNSESSSSSSAPADLAPDPDTVADAPDA